MSKGIDTPKPDAPGWYPDPWSATGEGERYFDGQTWGSTNRPLARHSVDPEVAAPSRRGRAKGRATPGPTAPTGPPTGARAARPSRGLTRIAPAAILVAIVGVLGAVQLWSNRDAAPSGPVALAVARGERPPVPADVSETPLGTPPPPPAGEGGYEFVGVQDTDPDVPVAFDPCRPVHYVVNPAGAPADGDQLIADAVARIAAATGLRFVAEGTTTEAFSRRRAAYQPEGYGPDRWAPVLIAWSTEGAEPTLAGYIAGAASPYATYTDDGSYVYVSGAIVLDAADLGPDELPDRDAARAVVVHELGHLVGLAHTADATQLMYSEGVDGVTELGVGDLRGLAVLGTQACFPDA